MSHTKGRLAVDTSFLVFDINQIAVIDERGLAVALTGIAGAGDELESFSNARRIAACWNACAGLTTEELEAYKGYQISSGLQLIAMKQQRDELLAALEGVIAWDKRRSFVLPYAVRDPIRTAIASVKCGAA